MQQLVLATKAAQAAMAHHVAAAAAVQANLDLDMIILASVARVYLSFQPG
jgi:predicted metal-dependent HD superfamily phosphohydrolase